MFFLFFDQTDKKLDLDDLEVHGLNTAPNPLTTRQRTHSAHPHPARFGEMVHVLPLLPGNHGYQSPGRWMGRLRDGMRVIFVDLFFDLEGRCGTRWEVQWAELSVGLAFSCTYVDCVCACVWRVQWALGWV